MAGGARQLPPARARRALSRQEGMGRRRRRAADPPRLALPRAGSRPGPSTSASMPARDFAPERAQQANVYEAVAKHVAKLRRSGRQGRARQLHARARASGSPACSRIMGSRPSKLADSWQEALGSKTQPALIVLPLDHGFTTPDVAVLTEQDMLGDRLVRRRKKRKAAAAFLEELAALIARRPRRPRRPWHRPLRGADPDPGRQGAARLRRARICARQQALRAGREYRAAVALRQRQRGRRRSTASAARRGSGASRG